MIMTFAESHAPDKYLRVVVCTVTGYGTTAMHSQPYSVTDYDDRMHLATTAQT